MTRRLAPAEEPRDAAPWRRPPGRPWQHRAPLQAAGGYEDLPLRGSIMLPVLPADGEALSSLLMRLAAAHGISYSALMKRLGVRGDADFEWPWSTASTARFLELDVRVVRQMLVWRSWNFTNIHREWTRGTAGSPEYGVCWMCCHVAGFVHYGIDSRFSFISQCHLHKVRLVRPPGFPRDCSLEALGPQPLAASTGAAHLRWEKRMRAIVSRTLRTVPEAGGLNSASTSLEVQK